MMRGIAVGGLIAGVMMGTGCGRQPDRDPDLIAMVGSTRILVADLQREMSRRAVPVSQASCERVLQEIITQRALVARAREMGLERHPDVIRAYENLLVSRLKESELSPRTEALTATPEEIRDAYARTRAERPPETEARLALLFVASPPKASPSKAAEIKARIEEARRKALLLPVQETSFGPVAVEFSDDQASRYKGGDLGWLEQTPDKYRWNPAVLAAGFALQTVREVSDIIETREGYYLVKLMGRRADEIESLERLSDSIRHQVLLGKRKELEEGFVQEAREAAGVKIFPDALKCEDVASAGRNDARPDLPPIP